MWKRNVLGLGVLAFALCGIAGCGSAGEKQADGDRFESDDPSWNGSSGGYDDSDGAGGPSGEAPGSDEGHDPGREIAEADIVQIQGSRLYALSRSGGLSVIDIGKKDRLRLLGRHRSQAATPFEMYVRENVIVAMYSDWGKWVYDAESKSHRLVQISQVAALDVSNPGDIREIGHFEIPGSISDSRLVGDVLYVISHRDGSCWDCGSQPGTVVTSLDLSDRTSIRRVDELEFPSPQGQYSWGKRSVTVTPKRMYVAGPEWATNGYNDTSTIQIIDIEDPKGDLVLGASVEARGRISSRWQMDEHDGVLRVISQPNQWNLSKPPRVQTFEVVSSSELRSLGSLDLKLPRPEELKSARFDGTRAYAITFERTDPLLTIDLSNPSTPVQKGELEIPGWVHHMEPRGDRLYGLGFENGHKDGSLHVSIFDVSDLSKPTMLDRVNFGGEWSQFAEDQDRIHKAFQLIPDANLILVPFTAYDWSTKCGRRRSGIQLIDLDGDALTKRGFAPALGEARRAFLHQDRLFTMSDDRAQSFDIDDRDQPKPKASVKLAHRVDKLLPAGEHLVRLALDRWTNTGALEVVRKTSPDEYEALGSLDLDATLFENGQECSYTSDLRDARLFMHGHYVYVVVHSDYSSQQKTVVLVIDIADPSSPRLVKKAHLPIVLMGSDITGQRWDSQVIESGSHAVQIGSTLVFLERKFEGEPQDRTLHVVDLSNPIQPQHTTLALPDGKGRTGLQAYGNTVMLGRWAPIADKPSKVRFYVDRIDVSNPSAPKLLPSVNVPGSLLSFDAMSSRLVTVDYRRETTKTDSLNCRDGDEIAQFDYETGTCTKMHRSIELLQLSGDEATRLDREELQSRWISEVVRGDDRVFLVTGWSYDYYDDCDYGYGYGYGCGYGHGSGRTFSIVGGARAGHLRIVNPPMDQKAGGIDKLVVTGQRVMFTGSTGTSLHVLDSRQLTNPRMTSLGSLHGRALDMAIDNGQAYIALGGDGVQSFEVPK